MAAQDRSLVVAFLDIGNTLGRVNAAGQFAAFPSTAPLLRALRDTLGLRLGVITNLPAGMSRAQAQALLEGAGLGGFLDPDGLVTNHEAGADKPDPRIYQLAADRLGAPVGRCRYIADDPGEVLGAEAAGSRAVRKPLPPGGAAARVPDSLQTGGRRDRPGEEHGTARRPGPRPE